MSARAHLLEDTDSSPDTSRQSDEKRRQILEGARQVFLADGFDGASMNDIARVAGVSKGTLYVYFSSKEALFAALIRDERRQQAEQVSQLDFSATDVRASLYAYGVALVGIMTRPDVVAQVRIVIAVAPKFPEIGRAFYESGPLHGRDKLAAFLLSQAQAERLVIADTKLAATHFIQLCQGETQKQMMFGIASALSRSEIEATVSAAVTVFMKAYGP